MSKNFKTMLVAIMLLGATSVYMQPVSATTQEEEEAKFEELSQEAADLQKNMLDSINDQTADFEDFDESADKMIDTIGSVANSVGDIAETEGNLLEKVMGFYVGAGAFLIGLMIFFLIIAVIALIFNIVMIIDCLNRDFKDKTMWLVILIVGFLVGFGFIASIIYYFVVKQKNLGNDGKSEAKESEKSKA